jgi:hypothetical protein
LQWFEAPVSPAGRRFAVTAGKIKAKSKQCKVKKTKIRAQPASPRLRPISPAN